MCRCWRPCSNSETSSRTSISISFSNYHIILISNSTYRHKIVPVLSYDDPTSTSTINTTFVLPSEIEASIKRLKPNKALGEDNIAGGILQDGGKDIIQLLTYLLSTCLHHCQVPKAWKNALIGLIHKKGNTSDIKNYRPISLLPVICKVFSNTSTKDDSYAKLPLTTWANRVLVGYSTINHIQVVQQLQEKANEYNIPFRIAIVDYEKAFQSIEFDRFFEELKNQDVDERSWTSCKASIARHQLYDSISTAKISNMDPNSLHHVYDTASLTRSIGKTKAP